MPFTDLAIKQEYRSLQDSVVSEFYTPILKETVLYRRAVGFFSSSALIELTNGIAGLLKNHGHIDLIASPKLTESDIEAIEDGFERKDEIIESCLLRELNKPEGKFQEARLNLLSNLIASGILSIRIAFLEEENTVGMFHEKLGLMYDKENNIIAFTGSMNESANAFSHNYESIDVYTSWSSDLNRVLSKQKAFSSMWGNFEPHICVKDFPQVGKEIIQKYKISDIEDFTKIDEFFGDITDKTEHSRKNEGKTDKHLGGNEEVTEEKIDGPHIPKKVSMREYQLDAIEKWKQNNYCGIFDMATGTGKTYTALAAISRLYKDKNGKLAVIIVCPYMHLVDQWKEDIVAFGMKPIICYSASPQKNWRDRLKTAARSFNMDVQDHFCMVTTNATFSQDYVQSEIKKLKGNVLLVVDEAHNFGSENLSTTLLPNASYRLALSATIDRHGDPEGTKKIYEYFGEKCIEYTLKDAIDHKMLTPYYYYPVVVSLNDEELEKYIDITEKIKKNLHSDKDGRLVPNEYAKMMLIKRARIVAGACSKIVKLRELMMKYREDNQILVYCGATTMHDIDFEDGVVSIEDAKQIDIVAGMLGNDLGMRISKFTSEESTDERERIKADFAEGKHLQAVVAIRCLDEGVNIPSIRTAFILASSTNPKEYVQRRGRVLRKFPGKEFATIYDFITLPYSLEEVGGCSADEIASTQSLARREIVRMKDFAAIAENPYSSDLLISEIQKAYGIEEIEKVEELEEDYV